MLLFKYVAVFALVAVSFAQDYDYDEPPRPRPRPGPGLRPAPPRIQTGYSGPAPDAPRPTPTAILKQINKHNEDGSYTYGYEAADGTFKIETKLATGEVKGKYGYVDDTGKVRVVEYGATKYGFEPSGEGITVPPPTLLDENSQRDQEYYEEENLPPPRPQPAPRPRPRPQPQPSFESYSPPQQFEPAPAPPKRLHVPGAAPTPGDSQTIDFGPPSRSFGGPAPRPRPAPVQFAQPAPIEEEQDLAPAPKSLPRITYAQPAPLSQRSSPSFSPAPRPPPSFSGARPAPRPSQSFAPSSYAPKVSAPSNGRSGGILDQLSKEYALPSDGAAPLHDISFGYY